MSLESYKHGRDILGNARRPQRQVAPRKMLTRRNDCRQNVCQSYKHDRNTKGVFGTVPVFSVPVWTSYRTYRSVRYRYGLTEVSGTGIDVVPNLPKCPVPVLKVYRTYRSVRHRY